jgi:formylglycine-generating enzyme required for sulfatase activity
MCISDEMCPSGQFCGADGICRLRDMGMHDDLRNDLMCPSYPAGGGGGLNRPEVRVKGGMGQLAGMMTMVEDFYLDVFDVTVRAYRDCVSDGKCSKPAIDYSTCNWTDAVGGRENHPINCVTLEQAKAFCLWAGGGRRVPTEAEWSYAEGEGISPYPWGADAPQDGNGAQGCWDRYQVSCGDGGLCNLGTCPVGPYGKTLRGTRDCGGIADLAGNLYRWLDTEYEAPQSTCSQNCSLRGGCWVQTNSGDFSTSQRRDSSNLGYGDDVLGFRCARNAP